MVILTVLITKTKIKSLKLAQILRKTLSFANFVNALVMLSLVFDFLICPNPVFSANIGDNVEIDNVVSYLYDTKLKGETTKSFPTTKDLKAVKSFHIYMTAYNSEVGQCDDTPCITANGFDVCKHNSEDTIATNILPFGTKLRIPEYFGDRVFVVRDRMNSRYTYRMDIWMKDKTEARKFGLKYAEIEILE